MQNLGQALGHVFADGALALIHLRDVARFDANFGRQVRLSQPLPMPLALRRMSPSCMSEKASSME
jgi:hypothetical protein